MIGLLFDEELVSPARLRRRVAVEKRDIPREERRLFGQARQGDFARIEGNFGTHVEINARKFLPEDFFDAFFVVESERPNFGAVPEPRLARLDEPRLLLVKRRRPAFDDFRRICRAAPGPRPATDPVSAPVGR